MVVQDEQMNQERSRCKSSRLSCPAFTGKLSFLCQERELMLNRSGIDNSRVTVNDSPRPAIFRKPIQQVEVASDDVPSDGRGDKALQGKRKKVNIAR